MKKAFGIFLVVALVAFIVSLRSSWSAEPVYQGKTLTAWLRQYREGQEGRLGHLSRDQAGRAIREIGTNAVPVLLTMIAQKDEPSVRSTITRWSPPWADLRSAAHDRAMAAYGITALGPAAE